MEKNGAYPNRFRISLRTVDQRAPYSPTAAFPGNRQIIKVDIVSLFLPVHFNRQISNDLIIFRHIDPVFTVIPVSVQTVRSIALNILKTRNSLNPLLTKLKDGKMETRSTIAMGEKGYFKKDPTLFFENL